MTAVQLITEYKFSDRGSVQASVATGVVRGLTRASDEAAGKGGVLSSVWNSVGNGMSRITGIVTNLAASVARLGLQAALIGGAAILGAVTAFGVAAFNAAADMDSLRRGLIAVAGSAEEADRQLVRLRDVARLPGLGFQEAIQGSINLQAAGLSAGLAERALRAFGNALATVGKGREELFGVLIALTQISAKGRVSAEEVLQLQERLPQIRQAMKGAFGTADTEKLAKLGVTSDVFIAKIVEQFEKLPQASGGMRNAIENLTDSWTTFKAAAGEALGTVVVPLVDRLGSALDTLVSSGAIQRIVEGFTRMLDFETLGHKMIVGLTWMLATIKEIPGILQTVGGYLGQWFQFIGKNLSLIQAMLLLAFGTTIVRAVIGLATAIGAVIKAIRSATLAQMLFEAVATKGATIVASLLAAAAAYFAFRGIVAPMFQGVPTFDTDSMSKHQQNITSEQQRLAGMLGVGGSWFDVVMNQLMRTRQGASAADDAGGTLAQIARNTAETARNTKMEVDLRKMAFGGGQTGRLGVTAVEMNQIRREVRLRVDKTGFRGLQLAMLEMFEEFLAQAERAGALRR